MKLNFFISFIISVDFPFENSIIMILTDQMV